MNNIDRLKAARDDLNRATEERIRAIRAARDAGHTWREIAAALGVTERNVTALIKRRENTDAA